MINLPRSKLEIAIEDEINRLVALGYKGLLEMPADVQAYDRAIFGKSYSFEVRIAKVGDQIFVLVEGSRNFLFLIFFGIQRAFSLSSKNEMKIIPVLQFPNY